MVKVCVVTKLPGAAAVSDTVRKKVISRQPLEVKNEGQEAEGTPT